MPGDELVHHVRRRLADVLPSGDDLPRFSLEGPRCLALADQPCPAFQEVAGPNGGQEFDLFVCAKEALVAVAPNGDLGGEVPEQLHHERAGLSVGRTPIPILISLACILSTSLRPFSANRNALPF